MATITVTEHGIYDPSYLARWMLGDVYAFSSTEVKIWNAANSSTSYLGTYTGSFLQASDGSITGTVTGFAFSYKSSSYTFITIEDINLDAAEVFSVVQNGNVEALLSLMLSGGDTFQVQNLQVMYGEGHVVNAYGGDDTIYGSSGDDFIYGNTGSDLVYGRIGNDTLVGGGGADFLAGGAGADTFMDTAFGLNGDTITDFSRADRIVIIDASLAGFSFSFNPAGILQFTGGSIDLPNSSETRLAASVAPEGGVQIGWAGPPIIQSAFVLPPVGGPTSAAAEPSRKIATPAVAEGIAELGCPWGGSFDGWHAPFLTDPLGFG